MPKHAVLRSDIYIYFSEDREITSQILSDEIGTTSFEILEDEDLGKSESRGFSFGLYISLIRYFLKNEPHQYQYGLCLTPDGPFAEWGEEILIDNYLLSLLRNKGFPLLAEDDQRVKDTILEGEVYFWDTRNIVEMTKMMNALFASKFKMSSNTKSQAYMLGLNVTLQDTGEEKNEQKKYLFSAKDHRIPALTHPDVIDITDYIKNIFTAESVALAIED